MEVNLFDYYIRLYIFVSMILSFIFMLAIIGYVLLENYMSKKKKRISKPRQKVKPPKAIRHAKEYDRRKHKRLSKKAVEEAVCERI